MWGDLQIKMEWSGKALIGREYLRKDLWKRELCRSLGMYTLGVANVNNPKSSRNSREARAKWAAVKVVQDQVREVMGLGEVHKLQYWVGHFRDLSVILSEIGSFWTVFSMVVTEWSELCFKLHHSDYMGTKADRIAVFKQEIMMAWTRVVASGGGEK